MAKTNKMCRKAFILICLHVLLAKVKSICNPCQCLPNDNTPRFLICQGRNIDQYPPFLDDNEKKSLKEIYLTETYIYCLPSFEEEDYDSLELFDENNNIGLNCSCLLSWRRVPTFNSQCIFDEDSVSTAFEQESTESERMSTSTGESSRCPPGSGRGTTIPPPPSSPATGEGQRWPWPTLTIPVLIATFLLIIIVATALIAKKRHCFKRSRVCCPSQRGVTTRDLPMHVINPIYTGPDLEWE